MPRQLDWYLHRKNWASCAKSEAWIEAQGLAPVEQVDARKERFDEGQAAVLMANCDRVLVARGKSWQAYDPTDPVQAEEMRKKEAEEYIQKKGDLEHALANLIKAIDVLTKGTTFEKSEG